MYRNRVGPTSHRFTSIDCSARALSQLSISPRSAIHFVRILSFELFASRALFSPIDDLKTSIRKFLCAAIPGTFEERTNTDSFSTKSFPNKYETEKMEKAASSEAEARSVHNEIDVGSESTQINSFIKQVRDLSRAREKYTAIYIYISLFFFYSST